jgi:hypothetical protein
VLLNERIPNLSKESSWKKIGSNLDPTPSQNQNFLDKEKGQNNLFKMKGFFKWAQYEHKEDRVPKALNGDTRLKKV